MLSGASEHVKVRLEGARTRRNSRFEASHGSLVVVA